VDGTHRDSDLKTRVLEATNIVELIGQTVQLKRAGRDFIGLCPFHQEKTPSFHVYASKQFYYCYGCKKHGNAIDFVIERDRVEFVDAMRTMAEAKGIPVGPKGAGSGQRAGETQILRDAHSAACQFYEKQLAQPALGQAARDYLVKRGFNDESIQKFRIGLAAEGWDRFATSPQAKKFTPAQLALAGLLKPRQQGEGYYDTFRDRLMFPIFDKDGRIIAFGGRVMPGSDDPAKYLNSPQTPLFDKGRCAFGLHLAQDKIRATRTVAVVEGYTDVVMAHQFGCTNVVSVLGTALTARHLELLSYYADRVVLLFDPDAAGDVAVDRALELYLTQEKVEVAIASLPDGLDPDEFLLKHGAEAFDATLAGATDALAYKWRQLSGRMNQRTSSLNDQQKAVDEYLTALSSARKSGHVDPIRWGSAVNRVSRLTGIPPEQLQRRLGKPARSRQTSPLAHAPMPVLPKSEVPTANDKAEGFVLGYLLCEPADWADIQKFVEPAGFAPGPRRMLAEIYWQHQRDEGQPVLNQFLSLLDGQADIKELATQLAQEVQTTAEPRQFLQACIEYFRLQRLRLEQEKQEARLRASNEFPLAVEEEAAVLQQLSDLSRIPDPRRMSVRYGI